MARSTTRTQRASQSQQSQSQSQRAPRRRDEEEEEDVDDEEQGNSDADDEETDVDIQRRAHALVRLALFNEQRRLPLRRDEISKKVLGSKGRRFAEILQLAQQTLRKTFGMELVELQRVQVDGGAAVVDDTEKDKEKDGKKQKKKEKMDAVGMKKKAAPTGTKTYILRSTLHPQLIALAVSPSNDIKAVEQAHHLGEPESQDDDDDIGVRSTNTGAILKWENADQLSAVGILYVVLALVLVHGRAISDADLRRILKRLRIPLPSPLPLTASSTTQPTIDNFLTLCTRQGYLERHRIGDAKSTTSKKRSRGGAGGGEEEGETYEWRWGPRAMAEVGEMGVARFVAEFMVDSSMVGGEDGEDADGEGGEGEREEKRKKKVDVMLRGVERASGGDLGDEAGMLRGA